MDTSRLEPFVRSFGDEGEELWNLLQKISKEPTGNNMESYLYKKFEQTMFGVVATRSTIPWMF